MHDRARLSLLISAAIAGVFAFWGGWTRRWMSDDGLIVLRTVRNILAGNGPVFNVGERVEANTSTLWQYLIAAFGWIPGVRLEDVSMWLALIFTVTAAASATWASGRLWGHTVLPFGIIIYLALPPARDFATSGLEWGLSLAWIGVWWALLVGWAKQPDTRVVYWLAFWAGLSWLVRPELALYGGLTGLVLLFFSWRDWRRIGGILAAALPVPAAYQIFRMGYYGLLTPHTAVAKSASDSAWGSGAAYVWDTVQPYALWLPLIGAVALGVWFGLRLQSREVVVVGLVLVCGLLHMLYVMRVGGDFMHGRMVLLPLFALLLPVMAVPATLVSGIGLGALVVWAGIVVYRGHDLGFEVFVESPENLVVVDEREFWTAAMMRESGDPPRYAEDFLVADLLNGWPEGLEESRRQNSGALTIIRFDDNSRHYTWVPRARTTADTDLQDIPTTAYLINLGMISANAPLDVRVLDSVGLATPLGARQPRDPDGRIGHDKNLPLHWQLADSAVGEEGMPDYVDKQTVMQARAALRTPELNELLATSREPMSPKRFLKNMAYSLRNGRTLEVSDDPKVYLDQETLDRIVAGEDVGLQGPRIFWPTARLEQKVTG